VASNISALNDVFNDDPRVTIPENATFAELFSALHDYFLATTENVWRMFDDELAEHFSDELRGEIIELEVINPSRASETRVLDVFVAHGYSEHEVSLYLPIEWI